MALRPVVHWFLWRVSLAVLVSSGILAQAGVAQPYSREASPLQLLGEDSGTAAQGTGEGSSTGSPHITSPAAAESVAPVQDPSSRTFRVLASAEGCIGGRMASGKRIKARTEGAALPSREGLFRKVRIVYLANGRKTEVKVLDVGPWNTDDPYWTTPEGRPQAESGRDRSGRRTNEAGIDILNGSWYKLLGLRTYDRHLIENTTGTVDWNFIQ